MQLKRGAEMNLVIRHVKTGEEFTFQVENPLNMKTAAPAVIPAPDQLTVEGRPNSNLLQDLRWYLENFLDYPFSPNTDIADRVQEALSDWGKKAFSILFAGKARDWYQDARKSEIGLSGLQLKIACDDPRILAWPWEALCDPDGTTLAHTCCIERQLNELHDPLEISKDLSADCINILLIIARPFGDRDVGYHAISRPLVDMARKNGSPVHIDVLRPPTFNQLQKQLQDRKNFYHIIHFDGHGGYGEFDPIGYPFSFKGPSGRLLFETEDGREDLIGAEKLTRLMTDYRIPVMVLNACQSARIDSRAKDPFASVAAALLKAGIHSVVAMGYNLYVSAAKQFVPAFYEKLFDSNSVSEAVRAGRRSMLTLQARDCSLGTFDLQDWLVPIVYGQDLLPLTFKRVQTEEDTCRSQETMGLPPEAVEYGDHGFIGRDQAIHELEKAMRLQHQGGILIHGMAGIGKTTLVQGFLDWLAGTNGLYFPPIWFRFDEIRNAEFVINRMVSTFFDTNALAASMDQKIDALHKVLRENPVIVVWDNFESAAGIPGTELAPQIPDEGRRLLHRFLQGLRGGKTKVFITSRSPEKWLTVNSCFRLPLRGLRGEECWRYCNAVVRDIGLSIERDDPVYADLIKLLEGHPLAMRAVLLRLNESDAKSLKQELEKGFLGAKGDESTIRIYTALDLLIKSFPAEFNLPLQFIGLHQRYVDINFIEAMGKSAEAEVSREVLKTVFSALENAGQLHGIGNGVYSMHPALTGYLRSCFAAAKPVESGFIHVMGNLANSLTSRELHEQRGPFSLFGGSFSFALELARKNTLIQDVMALTLSLAAYSQNIRDYESAKRLFKELGESASEHGHSEVNSPVYHQLGIIAEEQRDFKTAETWYKKSLEISEKQGNEHWAASTYHQLGIIAQEQRDFKTAETRYKKSLEIFEKQGNEHGAAITYHQLGRIAEGQRDFKTAETWYKKSLEIFEKQGNEHEAASTYHQLGRIAEEQRDFKTAETWYKKSLEIFEKQGNINSAEIVSDSLNRITKENGNEQSGKQ